MPLVFGDIVVPRLQHVLPLMTVHGFKMMKNQLMAFVLLTNVITYNMIYPVMQIYFSYQTISYHQSLSTIVVYNVCFLSATLYALLNRSFDVAILERLPSVYLENRHFIQNLSQVFIVVFFWSVVEGLILIAVIVAFVSRDFDSINQPTTVQTSLSLYHMIMGINNVTKTLLFLSRPNFVSVCLLSLVAGGLHALFVLIRQTSSPYRLDLNFLDEQTKLVHTYLHSVLILGLALNYASAIVIAYFKRHYFNLSSSYLQRVSADEALPTNE